MITFPHILQYITIAGTPATKDFPTIEQNIFFIMWNRIHLYSKFTIIRNQHIPLDYYLAKPAALKIPKIPSAAISLTILPPSLK